MSLRICINGHRFNKTSSCPVCPMCSSKEMHAMYGEEFPKLSAPAFRALHNAGITKLVDITKYSEKELLALHGLGPSTIKLLRPVLSARGLSFSKHTDAHKTGSS